MTVEEEIRSLEEEIRKTQYNKATSHHIGRLKAKIARLRQEQEKRSASKAKRTGVRKAGDATVVLLGPVGAGKSTTLQKLTGAKASEDPYDLTTVPGILSHNGAKIQVLDVPDLLISKDAISTVRDADLIIILRDPFCQDVFAYLDSMYNSGIRLNQRPPDVIVKRTAKGGIVVNSTVDLKLDRSSIEAILNEYRIHSADVSIREAVTEDQLIDALESNRRYIPAIDVLNKSDLACEEEIMTIKEGTVVISALNGNGLLDLKEEIFRRLKLIRIFMKPQGGQADMTDPMILQSGASIGDLCDRIHKDFRTRFRFATIWGSSAKHEGQRIGMDHLLQDGDIVTIVIQK